MYTYTFKNNAYKKREPFSEETRAAAKRLRKLAKAYGMNLDQLAQCAGFKTWLSLKMSQKAERKIQAIDKLATTLRRKGIVT